MFRRSHSVAMMVLSGFQHLCTLCHFYPADLVRSSQGLLLMCAWFGVCLQNMQNSDLHHGLLFCKGFEQSLWTLYLRETQAKYTTQVAGGEWLGDHRIMQVGKGPQEASGSVSCWKQGQQRGHCSKPRQAAASFFRNLLFEWCHEAAFCSVSPLWSHTSVSHLQPDSAALSAEFGYFKVFVYMDTWIISFGRAWFLYSLPGLEVGWLIFKLCQRGRKGNPTALAHHG